MPTKDLAKSRRAFALGPDVAFHMVIVLHPTPAAMFTGSIRHARRYNRSLLTTALVILAALLLASPIPAQESERGSTATRTPRAQAAGKLSMQLAVATRQLQRGDTVKATDFVLVDSTVTWRWSMPTFDSSAVQPGWIAQRAIEKGEVLRTPAVRPPVVIVGGSAVKVLFRDGPVQIVIAGTAVTSAALGAPVSVRIDRTRRLDGIAVAPNTVQLR